MRYQIATDEMLVLRDGRPFGEVGTFGGTSLSWPLPQTIAGMCRTALGFQRDPKFFKTNDNIDKIMAVAIRQLLPFIRSRNRNEFLLPTPADLLFSDQAEPMVHPLCFSRLDQNEGADISCLDWLFPQTNFKGKPSRAPMFLRSTAASLYFEGKIDPCGQILNYESDTVKGPVRELRIHSSINPVTHSVNDGGLFAESGILLAAARPNEKMGSSGELRLGFALSDLLPNETLPSDLYLGGERKRVTVSKVPEVTFPACPSATLNNERFLKIVLTTHGDFGNWIPDWLVPQGDLNRISWVTVPGTDITIRLRSAVISGWDPVSGWDYALGQPKPFRKLVRPGSVYLVELQSPSQSASLAQALWGQSICPIGSQAVRDGYGQVLLARSTHISDN